MNSSLKFGKVSKNGAGSYLSKKMDNWNLWWTISLWFQLSMKSAWMWKQKQKPPCYNRSNTICVSRYITLYEIENACLPVQCHRSDKLPDLLIQPFQKQSALLRKICLES